VSAVTAGTARSLRVSALGLQRASAAVAMRLERLCDHDVAEPDREEGTEQLYAALADVRLELMKLGEGADADTVDPERVVRVTRGRWHRQGWGRTS
jgi:hypothetical protein